MSSIEKWTTPPGGRAILTRISATRFIACLLAGLLIWFDYVPAWGTSAQAAAQILERLRSEGVAGWKELQRLQSQTEFEVDEQMIDNRQGQPARTVDKDYTFSYDKGSYLCISGEKDVRGGNAQYIFGVSRNSVEEPWFTSLVSDRREGNDDYYLGISVASRLPWSLFDVQLETIVSDPTFRVIEAKEIDGGLVSIRFQIRSKQDNRQLQMLRSGAFTCDPAQNWAVRSSELDVQGTVPTKIVESIEYGPATSDYLNVIRASNRTSWQDEQGTNEVDWESNISARKCELPAKAFTLSAFGLPEPVSRAERTRFWLWINLAGLSILVLAFWLRKRSQAAT